MKRPYRVKPNRQVSVGEAQYYAGAVVYLTLEEAQFHGDSIKPVFDINEDPDPPFEAELIAYQGQDFSQDFIFESVVLDIAAITPGATSRITTVQPHNLDGSPRINVRIASNTYNANLQAVASVIDANNLDVASNINLPTDATIAEVGVPVDYSASTLSGKVYGLASTTETLIFVGTFSFENTLRRITLKSQSYEEMDVLRIGDRLTCNAAGVSSVAIEGRSEIAKIGGDLYERTYQLASAATATLDSENVYAVRDVLTSDVGTEISGATFTFAASRADYGLIVAKLSSTVVNDLPVGVRPFRIFETNGGTTTALLIGSIEVVE